MIDSKRVLDSFLEMVNVYSPSFSEKPMADLCEEKLRALGFDIHIDEAANAVGSDTGNLIAVLPGNAEGCLALSAHLDTVLPCKGIKAQILEAGDPKFGIDEPIICSASDTILSADDRSGIAAIFEGIESALEQGFPRPTVIVLLTICEEQSLLGSSALDENALKERFEAIAKSESSIPCFVLDADGRPGTIIMGAPYHYTLRASFKGRSAHAGVEPEAGISAIKAASIAIAEMPLGRIDEHTTANVGIISGGVAVNVVPSDCVIEGECRSLHEEDVLAQKDAMTAAIENAAAATGAIAEIDWKLDYPGILFEEDDELVEHLANAIRAADLDPQLAFSGGGADANVLSIKGFNAITLGTGMTNFHSCDEFIRVADLASMARIVECLIQEYGR